MHSSRMCTTRFSSGLSCMHTPCHAHPLPCMPSATHAVVTKSNGIFVLDPIWVIKLRKKNSLVRVEPGPLINLIYTILPDLTE